MIETRYTMKMEILWMMMIHLSTSLSTHRMLTDSMTMDTIIMNVSAKMAIPWKTLMGILWTTTIHPLMRMMQQPAKMTRPLMMTNQLTTMDTTILTTRPMTTNNQPILNDGNYDGYDDAGYDGGYNGVYDDGYNDN